MEVPDRVHDREIGRRGCAGDKIHRCVCTHYTTFIFQSLGDGTADRIISHRREEYRLGTEPPQDFGNVPTDASIGFHNDTRVARPEY